MVRLLKRILLLTPALLLLAPEADACTCITVGKQASADGSVITSHTCDSHRTGSDIQTVPRATHKTGERLKLTKRKKDDTGPMERYARENTGEVPQVAQTFGYLAPAYASMNEFQVAIGESTFEGRKELVSEKGLIDCETLTRLMLERAKTAREAIILGGALIEKHGWIDVGEALTITDPNEAWHMEILGPGKDKVGAVWAARRIPDDHVSVVANASRIGKLDLDKPDWFMASKNVTALAEKNGWWDPKRGEFRFNYAYNPTGRTSFSCTRREWRVLSFLAPSLKLDPNSNEFPFSVKPEKKVTPLRVMEIFRDTYEGTPFDMTKNITVKDKEGKCVKSPLANPFMPYDMNPLFDINGGWGDKGERPLARWYAMYVTITQSRGFLPDQIGGRVWFGYSNPAMTTYVPIYVGVTELPETYTTDGRTTGFGRQSAWWAFNRLATIAAQRWGDMRKDIAEVRDPMQAEIIKNADELDKKAADLFKKDPVEARKLLTRFVAETAKRVTETYWSLGDHLWNRYDEKW